MPITAKRIARPRAVRRIAAILYTPPIRPCGSRQVRPKRDAIAAPSA
jgi:hypothetical protein